MPPEQLRKTEERGKWGDLSPFITGPKTLIEIGLKG